MIIEYFRPKKIAEAIELLSKTGMNIIPIGGGSSLNHSSSDSFAVVDLQELGLNTLKKRGNYFEIGATVTLQKLLEMEGLPTAIYQVIRHEATYNLRQVATIAGTLVASDGRSPFSAALLALDASLFLAPGKERVPMQQESVDKMSLGDLIATREEFLNRRLITQVTIPLNVRLVYEYVARTPADVPIVCVALANWPSGRTRLVLGGYGSSPMLALDGIDPGGIELVARDAYSQATDQWASAEYRQEIAGVLTGRCWQKLFSEHDNDLAPLSYMNSGD
jgi:CO/xanthine dehydrogenase FAD-binding subunit